MTDDSSAGSRPPTPRSEYRILGSLGVAFDGVSVQLGPAKQRAVLAVLLLNANEIVPTDRLIELIWGARAPRTAGHSIQIYVSELRRILDAVSPRQVIQTRPPGYVIEVEPDSIDARRFERLVGSGTREVHNGDLPGGAETLREALLLWGQPLSEFTYEEFAQPDIRRLGEIRLGALEELAGAELSLGHDQEVLLLVEEVLREAPLRERSRELQMVALYRTGRHAEALRGYQHFRALLADELGLDPSPRQRRLQEQILLHDPALGARVQHDPTSHAPAVATVRNPYKGLRPFREDDTGDFFGRHTLVGQLVAELAGGARLVALVGPSGSGKSSVVEAGLIPAVRRAAVAGSETWVIVQMIPGRHPFEELEAALLGAVSDPLPKPGEQPDDGDGALVRTARQVLPPEAQLLLVIDQFEELFSTVDEAEQRRFLHGLTVAVSEPRHQVRVVLTLRADFYDRPLLDAEFGPSFSRGVVNVVAMTAGELEAAIVRPAKLVGVEVAPALLAELVLDTAAQPAALPMLQYTLTELFDTRADDALTLHEYQTLGGLRGLLSRRSEALYLAMDPEHQQVALQVFLRLVRLGHGTADSRRRVTIGELTDLDLDHVLLSDVLEEFGRHRLLSFDHDPVTGDATVDVAHEAVLTEWDRLAGWIDGHRADLGRHAPLAAAADEWASSDRDPDYLFTGGRLADLEAWVQGTSLELTSTERDFVDASVQRRREQEADEAIRRERHRRLERRARTRLLALVAAVALLVGAITYGTLGWLGDKPSNVVLLGGRGHTDIDALVTTGFDEAVAEFDIRGEKATGAGPGLGSEDVRAFSGDAIDLQVALTPDCTTVVEPIARTHPDTRYVVFDCPGEQRNITYVSFAAAQGSFLAGAAAALESQTGVIGFIGGADMPLIWEFQAGYEAGAHAVDPNIEVQASYLSKPPDMTGFDNDILAFQVAERMYGDGADVIYHAAAASGTGVFEAALQLSDDLGRHLWAIGVDIDQYRSLDADDPWRPHILTSMVKRYDRAVYAILEEYANGDLKPGARQFDLADGGVDLADSGGFIDDIRPQLDALRARIIAGEIDVPTIPPDKDDEAAEPVTTAVQSG
jgi:basic membrane lipoprotein Med (substrate-binding protein (PBP1-ABC) superfamily)/DNA-binding SARP family transcriptional activator